MIDWLIFWLRLVHWLIDSFIHLSIHSIIKEYVPRCLTCIYIYVDFSVVVFSKRTKDQSSASRAASVQQAPPPHSSAPPLSTRSRPPPWAVSPPQSSLLSSVDCQLVGGILMCYGSHHCMDTSWCRKIEALLLSWGNALIDYPLHCLTPRISCGRTCPLYACMYPENLLW